jgi:hypothetical protein
MDTRTQLQPSVRYLTQRDNINPFTGLPDGHNQCMVATFTMMTNWLGDKYGIPILQQYNERTHLLNVGISPDKVELRRYNSENHAIVINKLLKDLKLTQQLKSKLLRWNEVKELSIQKQSPVEVSGLITKLGHIILYIGNNKWHDPYGKCSEKTLSYNGEGFSINGAGIEYTDKFILERIFRIINKNGNTIATDQKRTCWYFEGI